MSKKLDDWEPCSYVQEPDGYCPIVQKRDMRTRKKDRRIKKLEAENAELKASLKLGRDFLLADEKLNDILHSSSDEIGDVPAMIAKKKAEKAFRIAINTPVRDTEL